MAGPIRNKGIEGLIERVEYFVSVVLFTGMFGSIIIQVFCRYVLKAPLVWPYELSIYCFIYIIFIGAGIAARKDTHVAFSLMHDRMSIRGRLISRIISNLLIISAIISLTPSTYSFMSLMGGVRSSTLDIPMYFVLASFPLGMGLICIYLFLWVISYVKEFRSAGG